MDREHFDALTRLFAVRGSRRAAFSALVGAALLGSEIDTAEALQDVSDEHRRRRWRRRRRRGRRGRRGCKRAGRRPTFRKSCCPGLVLDANGRCAVPCSPDGTCCPGGLCSNGVCVSCPAGQHCAGNQCVCDGQSCPNGCCDDQGTCQSGNTDSLCGTGGVSCAACENPNPVCANKTCTTCADTNDRRCPSGCCVEAEGTCQPGNSTDACGGVGELCEECPLPGCCDGTMCQPGTADDACGLSGTCETCSGGTPVCNAGVCEA